MRRFVLPLAIVGCTTDPVETTTTTVPPETICAEHELSLPDGRCIRPGVAPERCAEGFVHDGEYGCDAVLPETDCAAGTLAAPGDTACRPVMPCAEGTWGAIPIDATTVYVDVAYAGGDSDGSASRPWPDIASAYAAAPPGALIAIARGSYAEDLVLSKAVRLWGVCPDEVEMRATGAELAAVSIFSPDANGSELHGVALTGQAAGVLVSGALDVTLDGVWLHDMPSHAIHVESTYGATSVHIGGTLVESAQEIGIYVAGSEASIEGSVVRATRPAADQTGGRGINAQVLCTTTCDPAARSLLEVRGSLVERNHDTGVLIGGSDGSIEASVVRDTLPQVSDQRAGTGVEIQVPCFNGTCDSSARANVTVTSSLIERSHDTGLLVMGSDAVVDDTVVRDTRPRASDTASGHGMVVQPACIGGQCDNTSRATTTVRGSLVERNHTIGLFVTASDVHIEATVVRDVLPRTADGILGRGIGVQALCYQGNCDPVTTANGTIRASLVERSHQVAVSLLGATVFVEDSVVRNTSANPIDGRYGDGLAIFGGLLQTHATLSNILVDNSARAGISNFGAIASIAGVAIRCAGFEIEGEPYLGANFQFEDRGGNRCGCPDAAGVCTAVSIGLEPPEAVNSVE